MTLPNSIDPDQTVTVERGETCTSSGSVRNFGIVENNGTIVLVDSDPFVNVSSGVLVNNGVIDKKNRNGGNAVLNSGDFVNNGVINDTNGNAVVNEGGTFINNGEYNNLTDSININRTNGGAVGGIVTGSGTFNTPNLTNRSGIFQPTGATISGSFDLNGAEMSYLAKTVTTALQVVMDKISCSVVTV